MNVAFINPPSPFLLDERVFPPLGLLQVAAAARDMEHDVIVGDYSGENPDARLTPGWDAYALTATTPQFPAAVQIARDIRQSDPAARIVLGGPHATVMPESCPKELFDCVVMGPGEAAILQALERDAPHVIDASKVDPVPGWTIPARDLIDMDSYAYSLMGREGTSMMWSHGCPYFCQFCCGRTITYYRRFKARAPESVAIEARMLADDYGIRAVMAFDDEVNINDAALLALCRALAPLGMTFRAFVKANLFTDRQAEAMAAAGFVEVCTGVESGDDRILKIMEKKTTRAINTRFVEVARRHGMRTKAFCSLGHAGESPASAAALASWLIEAKPDDFDVTLITVYPGTPIWEGKTLTPDGSYRFVKDGAALYFDAVDYASEFAFYKGRPREYQSHVWTDALSKADLVTLRDEVEGHARAILGIPYPIRHSGDQFEHSMGQGL